MNKLAIIGLVFPGLAMPVTASASSQGARKAHLRHAHTMRACLKAPIFPAGKNATVCGLAVWVRDPSTGAVIPVPMGKWRTEVPPCGP